MDDNGLGGFGIEAADAHEAEQHQQGQEQQEQQDQAQAQVPQGPSMTAAQFAVFLQVMQTAFAPQAPPQQQPLPDDDPSYWRHVRPGDIPLHQGREDKTKAHAWITNLQGYAKTKGLPRSQWTELAVQRLTGTAAKWFEGFKDTTTGITGNRAMEWDLFKKSYTKAMQDPMHAENVKKDWESDKLKQHTSVKRCIDIWNEWMEDYRSCEELKDFYSEEQIIDKFVRGLKGQVSAMIRLDKSIKTYEDAVQAALTIDPLLFQSTQAARSSGRGGFSGQGNGGFNSGGARGSNFNRDRNREGTPGPPGTPASIHNLSKRDEAIINAINALGVQIQGRNFHPRSGGTTPGSSGSSQYNSRNPPPKMTPAIREWCDRNRACYRCRTPNADHMSRQCPHFDDRPVNSIDPDPITDAIADLIDLSEPTGQGNGQ
mmetsp:Transcript_5271/g.10588  ORF Transcript_5271/g.10588 Transcript_5271/m.10588 type:complete len:428 (+) Transcript_5271:298-1581(+)|eukprot:CAMPEP_0181306542 /NCGR_PEP_ID=MMETSP1101-20121128/10361_1 /TAXON_ID=46948 /ORGANISM="Rhodomonas abbreviata, Strain Caron Lab Isolate" /LENGTH=427 /DNA_ID=CAMNT_0023412617 /DNA_START=366 /DNA_END=1649 /DNA_ORIENTATION=+